MSSRDWLWSTVLILGFLSMSCNEFAIPDGPPCNFDPRNLPSGWRMFELPLGAFYGPGDLVEVRQVETFEGIRYELSAPGLQVVAESTSSLSLGEEIVCSEKDRQQQRLVWRRFEENRAALHGHHFSAYLAPYPVGIRSAFSLWVHVEEEDRISDAGQIARSISAPRE